MLVILFSSCIQCGTYPEILKISQIILLFKSGTKDQCCNYRPISLLLIATVPIKSSHGGDPFVALTKRIQNAKALQWKLCNSILKSCEDQQKRSSLQFGTTFCQNLWDLFVLTLTGPFSSDHPALKS